MNVYITKVNGLSLWNPMQYRQWMTAEIAHQIGCREMGIFCYNGSGESDESLRSRIDGIIAGLSWGEDIVVCQFPTGNGFRYEWELVNRLKIYQGRVVIFIQDSEAVVREPNLGGNSETIRLYNRADVLIVPSMVMRQFLLEHGIRDDMKFVIQEMWDYTISMNFFNSPQFRKEIHVTGIGKIEGVDHWDYSLSLKWYADSTIQGESVHHIKGLPQGELVSELSKGGFGLVWHQDAESHYRMEYSASFELSRYLAAGIPVIVPRGISNQRLIEKNQLGLIVDSLDEAAAKVEAMTEGEYQKYIRNVRQFAPVLRNGYYMKKCLVDAVLAVHRKDAGKIVTPAKVYDPGACAFNYTVLKESYGGNLALSWDYHGETEGFLIYDLSGNLIYETRNEHQHYLLIKGYERESGFIVKAYVDTLKGKMCIAKSEPTYLYTEQYKHPKVSMIIPAYNAEDYISRSIDNALAQSFSDLEIIVVDDGSTDSTSDIVDWYAEKYQNVSVIHQENGGVASARNTGIEHANGEYIGFMDSDDMILMDMMERLYCSAENNGCDIAITSVRRIENDGYKVIIEYQMEEDTAIDIEKFFWIYFHTNIAMVSVCNKLYRASLVKEHLFPELFLGEDGAWTPYILSHADRICYLNEYLYEYDRIVCGGDSLSRKWGVNQSVKERFAIHKKMVTFYLQNGNPNRIRLLKVMAKWSLIGWKNTYSYDEYEKLWEQIDNNY